MNSSAAGRRFPSRSSVYPLAGVAMLAALLVVLLDLLYVALRSLGGPASACSAALLPVGAPVLPEQQVAGVRSWWPPSVVCEYSSGPLDGAAHSLTPGSQLVFWAAVAVFAAGFVVVGAICLGPAGGGRRAQDGTV